MKYIEVLKYTVIKNEKQYDKYCDILHDLDFSEKKKTKQMEDEAELLLLLIQKWDDDHRTWKMLDPVELLRSLMEDHQMKPKDMVELLDISKGYVSDILNYKKGFSKEVIRKLAERFKLNQEAFNRPYKLVSVPLRKSKLNKVKRKVAA